MPPKNSFVLDTSAVLALRSDESGADRVEALLSRAQKNQCRLLASFMSRMEVLYNVWRGEGEEAARHALRLMNSFSVQWVSCEPAVLEIASRIKAQGGLSVANSWIGATAIAYGATLVHKDPEFEPFKEIPQEILK
ncbi:MAG: PIN domain-containing protein [Candidatus Binatia bacterium]|jgi:predicted nucleic acid-binding protein